MSNHLTDDNLNLRELCQLLPADVGICSFRVFRLQNHLFYPSSNQWTRPDAREHAFFCYSKERNLEKLK